MTTENMTDSPAHIFNPLHSELFGEGRRCRECGRTEKEHDQQPENMTDEEMRIRIAELCGWVRQEPWECSTGQMVQEWKKDGEFAEHCCSGHSLTELPDYPGSLDAIAEAEKTLTTGEERAAYQENLARIAIRPDNRAGEWFLIHASARERAVAFIAVKGKA